MEYHPSIFNTFNDLDYPHKELLVYDDSPILSKFFSKLNDSRVSYRHYKNRLSIGKKRNEMIREAQGEIIQHLDDDDWYAPEYTKTMLNHLWDADLVKLTVFNIFDENNRLKYLWDTRSTGLNLISIFTRLPTKWGYGFSYMYRRNLCNTIKFPDINLGEDCEFIKRARSVNARLKGIEDCPNLVLHTVHKKNTSLILKLALNGQTPNE